MIHALPRHAVVMPVVPPKATATEDAEREERSVGRGRRKESSRPRHAATALLACICLALLLQHAHAQPALFDIGTLGGDAAYPNGMNATGQVVGGSYISGNTEQHAFLWTPGSANGTAGTMTDLGKLGGVFSFAHAINDFGQVVGTTNMPPDAGGTAVGDRAFLWTPGGPNGTTGTMITLGTLGTLGGWSSEAYGINNSHQVVGQSSWTNDPDHQNELHAFVWTQAGGFTDLHTLGGTDSGATAIGADGKIVGWATTTDGSTHAFLWTPTSPNATTGTMQDLGTLGGTQSGASGINAAGQVVGYSSLAGDAIYHSFLWTPGATDGTPGNLQMRDLGTLGGDQAAASAINDAGWISGGSMVDSVAGHATIWIPTVANSTTGSLADALTLGGSNAYANSINGSNQIAGYSSLTGDPTYSSDFGDTPIVHAFISAPPAGKFSQTIVFGALADKLTDDPDFAVSARATSGLPVSFGAAGACTVTGNVVHLTGIGSCTITASQAGGAHFNAAANVPQSFNVNRPKVAQTISFGPLPNRRAGDPDFTVSATASSGLPVSFSASYQCSVTGTTVQLGDAGTCMITASQAGDANYLPAAEVQQSFLIGVASVAGNLVDIGTPGGPTAEPRAMNAIGQVLAWATVSVNLPSHAWLWSPNSPNATSGAWNDLGTLDGSDDSQPYAINDSGEVVGSSSGPQGPQAFIWRPYEPNVPTGTMTALNSGGAGSVALGINNAHQVVGAFLTATGAQAALWTADGEMIPLDSPADAVATIALAISPDGKVAGYFQKADSSSRAFLWTPSSPNATTGSMQDLGTLGGSNAAAYAVNAAGQVVGVSETSDGFAHAVLWTPNGGMTDLNALGANSTRATGISDSGMITGQLTSADGSQHPFVWTPSAPNGTNGTMVDVQGLGGSQALAAGINNSGQIAGWSYLTGDPTTNDGISHIEHAFVTRPLAVSHLTQTTTFAALGDKIFGDVDFTVNATASSGLTVTFSASGSCAVTGDSVQITGAGSCTITASQPGNSTYAAATDVPRAFSIAKATQAAVTINAPASLTSGSAATLMSGGGNGSGAVTFSVGSSTGCSVSGDQLSVTIVTGTCSVRATKAADSNYNAASSGSASVTLLKGTAVLTLSNLTQAFDGTPKSVTVTTTPAGVTGVAVTYNGLSAPPTNAGSYAVIASLTNNNYQATNATGTLAIIASSLKNLTLSATSVPGGVTVTGTVTLMGKAPAGGVPVALSSSNTAAATVPAMVTVPANAMSAQFSVTTLAVAASASTVISGAWGGTKTASLSVTPAALSSVTVTPATITGGAPATGTVTLTGAAPTNGAVIPLSSSLSAAAVPASVTVPAGQTSATFPISTSAVSATAKPTISATYVSVTKTAALTVNAPGVSSVTLSPTSVKGGTSSTGTVTLTGIAPAGGLVVSLSSNKAATVPASVPVPTGSRSAVFTITTSTVKATTSAAITATGGGTKASATLTVTP